MRKKRVHKFRVRFRREEQAIYHTSALRLSLTASSTLADHQALEWPLMRPKAMEDLAAFSVREVKRRIFLCRRTVREKVKSKVIPASFLKIEGRGTFVGPKEGY